jgi:acyl-CoA thioester hydrolase
MPDASPKTDVLEFRVRYSETDQMGVVYHPNYLTFFEMGRTEMLRRAGFAYRDIEARGLLMMVVKAEVKYKAPARYDDELVLETTVDRITMARIDHSYKLFRKEPRQLLAEGATTLACVSRTGEIAAVPEEIRRLG